MMQIDLTKDTKNFEDEVNKVIELTKFNVSQFILIYINISIENKRQKRF